MISIREIADDKTTISSTRWAFAASLKFDMVIIVLSLIAFVTCHLIGKALDSSFLYAVVTMLGVLTSITGAAKALQGFENKKEEEVDGEIEKKEEASLEESKEL